MDPVVTLWFKPLLWLQIQEETTVPHCSFDQILHHWL